MGDPVPFDFPDPDYRTVGEVATQLRVSKMTVCRLIHTGALEANRVGRQFRIPAASLARYLASGSSRGVR